MHYTRLIAIKYVSMRIYQSFLFDCTFESIVKLKKEHLNYNDKNNKNKVIHF